MLKAFFSKSPDVGLNERASILVKTIWSVIAVVTLSLVANMLMYPENVQRYSVMLLILWPVSMILVLAAKKRYVYFSAFAYITFLILLILGFSWIGGGIKGHGIRLLPIAVLLAGLTMGKKEIWVFGLIGALGTAALVLADYYQQLPVREPVGESHVIYWLYTVTAIFLLCALVNLTVDELRKALVRSQEELALRKKSEEQLKVKNEKLAEIAFLQSHMVRRPVANVLGLISMMKLDDPADPMNLGLIPELKTAAQELDAVIRQIVQNTEEVEAILNKGRG